MCEPRNINKVNSYLNWLIYTWNGAVLEIKVPTLTGDSVCLPLQKLHMLSKKIS